MELSVQEVVDCCSLVRGMVVPDIFECIARHGGLCSGESYPAGGSGECRNDSCQAAANVRAAAVTAWLFARLN